jgi:hypothetical protein
MPSIVFEPTRDGARYVVYEPPQTGLYIVVSLLAVVLAAFVIGSLASAVSAGRC